MKELAFYLLIKRVHGPREPRRTFYAVETV